VSSALGLETSGGVVVSLKKNLASAVLSINLPICLSFFANLFLKFF
jgi:hypothetical protein